MTKDIQLAANIKKQVEKITCQNCKKTTLTFKSVDFGFGGNAVADMYCKVCKDEPAVIVQGVETY